MIKFVFTVMAFLAGFPAQAQELNHSPYETREAAIAPVDRIEVRGTFEVTVLSGKGAPSVRFQGPPQLLADARATVEDGTLTIAFRNDIPWSSNPGSRMSALVTLPRLASIRTVGPARVKVMGLRSEEFNAELNGAGQIEVTGLEAERVTAALGGSGSIRLEGTANEIQLAIGGTGSIEAKRLRVADAQIAIGGAGSVFADVSKTADIAVGGSGRVEIIGGATCTIEPANSTKVECR